MEPIFAAEICEIFIDFLHDDKRALAACSLVSKNWLHASHSHLFHTIIFYMDRFDRLHKLLQSQSVTFLHHVRAVDLRGLPCRYCRSEVCKLLKDRLSVSSLSLYEAELWKPNLDSPDASEAILDTFHGVTELEMFRVDFDDYTDYYKFLAGFDALQKLVLQMEKPAHLNLRPDRDDVDDLAGYVMATSLRSLHLVDYRSGQGEMNVLLDWLSSQPTVPEIQHLYVEDVVLLCFAKLAIFMSRIAKTLTHLELTLARDHDHYPGNNDLEIGVFLLLYYVWINTDGCVMMIPPSRV